MRRFVHCQVILDKPKILILSKPREFFSNTSRNIINNFLIAFKMKRLGCFLIHLCISKTIMTTPKKKKKFYIHITMYFKRQPCMMKAQITENYNWLSYTESLWDNSCHDFGDTSYDNSKRSPFETVSASAPDAFRQEIKMRGKRSKILRPLPWLLILRAHQKYSEVCSPGQNFKSWATD